MKRRLSHRGSAMLIAVTALLFITLVIPGLLQAFRFRNAAQTEFQLDETLDSLVNAVAVRATDELRPMLLRFPAGNFPPGYPRFTAGQPKIYGKGDPGFRIDVRQANGLPYNPPFGPINWTIVPEDDPQVWIGNYGGGFGIGNRVFPLRIRMRVCRIAVPSRPIPVAAPWQQGLPWPMACPADQIMQVNYTGLILWQNL